MMEFDFNSILFALSYALDCVEHDVLGVATNHGKRVSAIAVHISDNLGILNTPQDRQILCACAVMHDCALTEYVQDEFAGSYTAATTAVSANLGKHCTMGEMSMELMPFDRVKTTGAVLNHHENFDASGPFGKTHNEISEYARLIQISDTVDARFDFSHIDRKKLAKIRKYIQDNTGKLFSPNDASALEKYITCGDLTCLRNEKIDIHLRKILPGGKINCTPQQLIDFASVFAAIVDYKSHFTKNHSISIAKKAYEMAQFYGADETLAARLYFAGALHDIGKLVVDRDILEKPSKLDSDEYKHIQTHAYYTYKILSNIPGMEDITKWASHHHEKLDGTGYPFGLKGDNIGKWERLMACIDIYQALTEDRPYKKGLGHGDSIKILKSMADGGKLDGDIVNDIDIRYR